MNLKKLRLGAGLLSAALLVVSMDMTVFAADLNKLLPVAGLDLTLNEGVSMKKVAEEKGLDTQKEYYIVEPIEPTRVVKDEMVQALFKEYPNLIIADVDSYVNIRSIPGEEGKIVGKLYDKSVGNLLTKVDGWYKIESGSCVGYVKAEFCVAGKEAEELATEVGRRTASVNADILNVRKEPTTESAILGYAPKGEELTVTDRAEGWVQIKIEEGYGYVSEEFVSLSTEFMRAESVEEEKARLQKEEEERQKALEASRKAKEAEALRAAREAEQIQHAAAAARSGDSSLGQQVADFAVQFVGNPYVYGGSSLTNGTDCSGFTMAVYANFGVSLPHSAKAQNGKGTNVGSIENAIPGDLVYYSGHIGIYIGNGNIVHASNSRTGIIISNANYDRILGVRRIF